MEVFFKLQNVRDSNLIDMLHVPNVRNMSILWAPPRTSTFHLGRILQQQVIQLLSSKIYLVLLIFPDLFRYDVM